MKIVVFTGNVAYVVRKSIAAIDAAMPGLSWLIVVDSPNKTPGRLLKSQWRNIRRNGWRWIPYLAAEVWQRLFTRKAERFAAASPGIEFTAAALEARSNLRVIRVSDIHALESLEAVKAFQPDLGLSLAAPILRRPVFSIPKLGTINLHQGKVPDYRGMPPAFWELWNDEKSVGCTVHWVEDKLDTGDIVRQTSLARARFSTVRGLQLQLDEIGVDLMRDAAEDILHAAPASTPQGTHGKTYRKPTLAQVAAMQRKLSAQMPGSPALKRLLKQACSTLGLSACGNLACGGF